MGMFFNFKGVTLENYKHVRKEPVRRQVHVAGPSTGKYAYSNSGIPMVHKHYFKNDLAKQTTIILAMQCRSTSNCSDSCTPKTKEGWIAWLLDKKHKGIIINKNNRLEKLNRPRIWNLEYYNYFIIHYNIKPTIESFMEIITFKQKKSKDEPIKKENQDEENKDKENKDIEIETKTFYISETQAGDRLPNFYPEPRDVLIKKLHQRVLATSRKPACMDDYLIPPPYEDKVTLKQKLKVKKIHERKPPPPQIITKEGVKINQPNVTTETLINVVGPKIKKSQPNTTETLINVVSPKNMYLKIKNIAEKHIKSLSSTDVKHLNPFDKPDKTSTADEVVKKNL